MQIPLRIHFHSLDPSDAMSEAIRKEVDELEKKCDNIIGCEATVERISHHHRKGDHFAVHINLTLPHHSITVAHDPAKDFGDPDAYLSIRKAFRDARDQLEDHMHKLRDVRRHSGGSAEGLTE
jgi:ribosome-associated translation inhibitor RaiA